MMSKTDATPRTKPRMKKERDYWRQKTWGNSQGRCDVGQIEKFVCVLKTKHKRLIGHITKHWSIFILLAYTLLHRSFNAYAWYRTLKRIEYRTEIDLQKIKHNEHCLLLVYLCLRYIPKIRHSTKYLQYRSTPKITKTEWISIVQNYRSVICHGSLE